MIIFYYDFARWQMFLDIKIRSCRLFSRLIQAYDNILVSHIYNMSATLFTQELILRNLILNYHTILFVILLLILEWVYIWVCMSLNSHGTIEICKSQISMKFLMWMFDFHVLEGFVVIHDIALYKTCTYVIGWNFYSNFLGNYFFGKFWEVENP